MAKDIMVKDYVQEYDDKRKRIEGKEGLAKLVTTLTGISGIGEILYTVHAATDGLRNIAYQFAVNPNYDEIAISSFKKGVGVGALLLGTAGLSYLASKYYQKKARNM